MSVKSLKIKSYNQKFVNLPNYDNSTYHITSNIGAVLKLRLWKSLYNNWRINLQQLTSSVTEWYDCRSHGLYLSLRSPVNQGSPASRSQTDGDECLLKQLTYNLSLHISWYRFYPLLLYRLASSAKDRSRAEVLRSDPTFPAGPCCIECVRSSEEFYY